MMKQKKSLSLLMAFFMMLQVGICLATPHLPASDAIVLERLPGKSDPAQKLLLETKKRYALHPADVEYATELALAYLKVAKTEADPRYLGYIESVLKPWWTSTSPPNDILLIRATIEQSNHQFDVAIADLKTILKTEPYHPQALLTLASIYLVKGDYLQSQQTCMNLRKTGNDIVSQTCLLSVASLNGEAEKSYTLLNYYFGGDTHLDTELQVWVLTTLGEMAERLGKQREAGQHYAVALQQKKIAYTDTYLLAAYADYLLNLKRYTEVVELLKTKTQIDNLLLRYTIALDSLHSPMTASYIEQLKNRFKAAEMRGDAIHQRERARFEQVLMKNSEFALVLAKQNWVSQREPADVKILLAAALNEHDKATIQSMVTWVKERRLQDMQIDALINNSERR